MCKWNRAFHLWIAAHTRTQKQRVDLHRILAPYYCNFGLILDEHAPCIEFMQWKNSFTNAKTELISSNIHVLKNLKTRLKKFRIY
jgi:hypothetical protein